MGGDTLEELKELFVELAAHVDYCGYGDSWERECAVYNKLPERVEKMLDKLKEV